MCRFTAVDVTVSLLRKKAYETASHHQTPLPPGETEASPQYVRETVRRLMLECHMRLGKWNKARQPAQTIGAGKYRHVDEALRKTESP